MKTFRRFYPWQARTQCIGIALFAAMIGCAGGGPVATFHVTGTVKLPDGTPLSGGRILLRPDEQSKFAARGDIGSDGAFQLTTFEVGDGAIAGAHRVMITPPIERESLDAVATGKNRSRPVIDDVYQNLDKTPLKITVSADGSSDNHFDLVVEPPGNRRQR